MVMTALKRDSSMAATTNVDMVALFEPLKSNATISEETPRALLLSLLCKSLLFSTKVSQINTNL